MVVVELNTTIYCPLAQSVEHSAVRSPENGENSSLAEKSASENPAKSVKSKSKDKTTPSKESRDSMCRDFTRDT